MCVSYCDHSVTFYLYCARKFSTTILETCFSYHKYTGIQLIIIYTLSNCALSSAVAALATSDTIVC